MPRQPYNYIRREFPTLSAAGVDLIDRLLTYDPRKRLTAREALRHPWFAEHPMPKAAHMMPTFPSTQVTTREGAGQLRRAGLEEAAARSRWHWHARVAALVE